MDFRAHITPVILCFNEEANIGRCLERLRWAQSVIVLDSGSNDATQKLARGFANVRWYERAFDDHARQCNHVLDHLPIQTEWVLFLDADYVLTDELIEELGALQPSPHIAGWEMQFRYCVQGRPLRAALYPPRVCLFRRARGRYRQEGHTQVLDVRGSIERLAGRIHHDDRKPDVVFAKTQRKYARMEARWVMGRPFAALGFSDRVRRCVLVAPWLVPLWALLVRGVIWDGRAGWIYAWQRLRAEVWIAREVLQLWWKGNRQ
jgi:glycosyltransferase involved in cell wall biosynthesis